MADKPSNLIAKNKKASFEYTLGEKFKAGLMLEGWEVKSLRAGRAQISEAHILVRKGEVWLIGALITPLETTSTHVKADPTRLRKLLLQRREIAKLIGAVERRGHTLIPLELYWDRQYVKLSFALAKGKKTHDKRAAIKERDWKRDKAKLLKESNR